MNRPAHPLAAFRHVVVLDDDPFMLKVLERTLQALGMSRVTVTSDGAQALALAGDPGQQVDVILLDINMPGMDGIEFTRRLAALKYTGEIALVSGEASRMLESVERLIRSHDLRVLGSLQKPPTADALRALLASGGGPTGFADGGRRSAAAPTLSELSAAILAGKIVNYYQPKVSLPTGEVVGVECLARWQRTADSVIGPDQFIPLAEEYQLIGHITHCVLRNAIQQCRDWNRMGYRLNVAINVSMRDISDLEFPDALWAMLQGTGVDPQQITLEVTESSVMQHLSTVLDVLGRLRLRRFHLAIDDFGTGHSSLAQLRDLPFDELKIDRSFVHGASTSSTQRAICEATLHMATQLGMQVVAEGIEDTADRQLLMELGCGIGQGYLFARPMAPDALSGWLQSWPNRAAGRDPDAGLLNVRPQPVVRNACCAVAANTVVEAAAVRSQLEGEFAHVVTVTSEADWNDLAVRRDVAVVLLAFTDVADGFAGHDRYLRIMQDTGHFPAQVAMVCAPEDFELAQVLSRNRARADCPMLLQRGSDPKWLRRAVHQVCDAHERTVTESPKDAGPPASGVLDDATPQLHGQMVLVVDDDPFQLNLVISVLRSVGIQAMGLTSANKALAALASGTPGLILLDIDMPGMSGLELLRKLRATALHGGAPVIMVTAVRDREQVLESLQEGAADYIVKPYDRDTLLQKIQRAMGEAVIHPLK
jgi:EAL domain-containing protein (putative c-di-GMP-specific phosphodiesterase class I)/DNA-binding response OmpR family regulator